MANTIINNKFLHYKTNAAFSADLDAGYILPGSIALIDDVYAIWSHNKYLYCSNEEFSEVVNSIKGRLDRIEGDSETEGSFAYAVAQLGDEIYTKLGEIEEGKTVADLIQELKSEVGGDVMADNYTTGVEIGGMAKGTDISGKTAVEVLDLILKPEYAPVFTDATCTISCTGFNNGVIAEVGSTTPLESAYSAAGNKAKTAAGDANSNVVYGGEPTTSISVSSGSAGTNLTWGSVTTKPGTFVVQASRVYAAGTNPVVTNKGNSTNKTASNYSTIMSNASVNSRIDSSSYTIKAVTKTANHTIKYAYKIYASNATAGNLNSLGLKETVSKVEATLIGGAAGQLFAVPATYTNVKIEEYNATLNSWTDTTSGWTKGATTFNLPDGTEKSYSVYTRANVSGENMKARISATIGI